MPLQVDASVETGGCADERAEEKSTYELLPVSNKSPQLSELEAAT
jgi:hypothetical protein